jgi:glycine cleavage system transcriptional repressor
MRANIVLSMTGKDRVGLVNEVTERLLELGGNVETSRMARLGGEFAMLMLVSLPEARLEALEAAAARLTGEGYQVTTTRTELAAAPLHPDWAMFRIEVHGADHEGIIHEIAHTLSERGINIETMDTDTTQAPVSGTPLFSMQAVVSVPPGERATGWEEALEEIGEREGLEIEVAGGETRSGQPAESSRQRTA